MKNIPHFSEEEARRVLGSPEGRQLLELLTRDGGAALRKAADALKRGDAEQARTLLSPVMDSPEAAPLIDSLNRG